MKNRIPKIGDIYKRYDGKSFVYIIDIVDEQAEYYNLIQKIVFRTWKYHFLESRKLWKLAYEG